MDWPFTAYLGTGLKLSGIAEIASHRSTPDTWHIATVYIWTPKGLRHADPEESSSVKVLLYQFCAGEIGRKFRDSLEPA